MPLTDMRGEPVVAHKWYWIRDKSGDLVGTGKVFDSYGELRIFVGRNAYPVEHFTDFVPAELPEEYEQ